MSDQPPAAERPLNVQSVVSVGLMIVIISSALWVSNEASALRQHISIVEERLTSLDKGVQNLVKFVESNSQGLGSLRTRMDVLETKLESMPPPAFRARLDVMESEVKHLNTVWRDMEARVRKLEGGK